MYAIRSYYGLGCLDRRWGKVDAANATFGKPCGHHCRQVPFGAAHIANGQTATVQFAQEPFRKVADEHFGEEIGRDRLQRQAESYNFV